ncbi:protein of unknown function [Candidatus Hydrogenisulfobacillus filiaventi]|uniref:Uncharacterized protein n=1 Tax=Candidatus Hydrogenisulfobacillus filiaventi TaxID=2707344 RepID=A0A6F8ZCG7_9FIRM|nr:hypothetical protein [Bacillota bacterium]CAB1127726.1 protein of unknown function [Candidatus Hydrogenisulfobacillus filiaventi]
MHDEEWKKTAGFTLNALAEVVHQCRRWAGETEGWLDELAALMAEPGREHPDWDRLARRARAAAEFCRAMQRLSRWEELWLEAGDLAEDLADAVESAHMLPAR